MEARILGFIDFDLVYLGLGHDDRKSPRVKRHQACVSYVF